MPHEIKAVIAAAKTVREILSNPKVRVMPQSRASFGSALDRYEARSDKEYSLQDCVSMDVMTAESIAEILTNDHHFEQEGFAHEAERRPIQGVAAALRLPQGHFPESAPGNVQS